jgi:hypothetical protein
VEELVVVEDVVELDSEVDVELEVVDVVVDVVEDVELEGSSASPISTQGKSTEFSVKGNCVGEDTPLVAYSASAPSVPPLDPGDRMKPVPAVALTAVVDAGYGYPPRILRRKAPL